MLRLGPFVRNRSTDAPRYANRRGLIAQQTRDGSSVMPVHDWRRVSDGTFHDFHYSWVLEIKRALNRGLLPEGYYVMAEQLGGDLGAPDVLTLQEAGLQRTVVVRHTSD